MRIFKTKKASVQQDQPKVKDKMSKEGKRKIIPKRVDRKDRTNNKRRKRLLFFSNWRIATKIIIGFLIIAIVSTAMGIYAAISLTEVSSSSKTMYANMLLPSKAVSDLTENIQDASISLRQALLFDPDDSMFLAVLSPITTNEQSVSSSLSLIESLIPSDKMDTYQAVVDAYNAYQPIVDSAVEDIKNGNKEEIIESLIGSGELKQAEKAVVNALDDLMSAVTSDAAIINTNNVKTGDRVLQITEIAIGVVIILSAVIGFIISRGISRPVKELTKNIELLASGETDIKLDDTKTKDEVGKMREATRTIANVIKGLKDDTDMLIDAAVEGQLTVRADASKHQGTYRKIIEGINATMDAMIVPIKESEAVLEELAKGNLNAQLTNDFKGDFAIIKTALNETISTIKGYINDMTYVLGEMSEGVLTVKVESDYAGDFAVIKTALNKSIDSFNSVLTEINLAAEEVSSGTEQVSGSSQSISQGASSQASALEQLSSSISEIASQTKRNTELAGKANNLSIRVKDSAMSGNEKMKTLLTAMEEINSSSANISKIIKVIDDIAFQTNILALNAAVEAARAGVHGKGFAVVAEEVRNLAAKSAQAAKETTELIDGSISKTKAGTDIANVTAGALVEIVESVEETVNLSEEIASSSNNQAVGIDQINKGIGQLSDVVQSNSATAQEMAASSQEISGQAAMLKDMVGRFMLSDVDKNTLIEKSKALNSTSGSLSGNPSIEL